MNRNEYLNESELLHNGTCGFYTLAGDHRFHYHQQMEIVYVEKGELQIRAGAKLLCVSKNQFAVIKPYELHNFCSKTKNRCVCPILSDAYSNRLGQRNMDSCVLTDADGQALQIFKMYPAFDKLPEQYRQYYFSMIYHLVKSKLPIAEPQSAETGSRILRYIEENYKKPISIETIAAACSTNRNYVSTLVNQKTHMNFNSYVNRLRLTGFIDSYRPGVDKIADTARQCGFESTRTFYRAFRQEYGMTPSAYFSLFLYGEQE